MFWYVLQTLIIMGTSYVVQIAAPQVHPVHAFVFSLIVAFLATDFLLSIPGMLYKLVLFTCRMYSNFCWVAILAARLLKN